MSTDLLQGPLTVGDIILDPNAMTLTGTGGTINLRGPIFRVCERLMRRPGVIVPYSALIEAMYPNADAEPDTAHVILRTHAHRLRVALDVLSRERVRLRTEKSVGYVIHSRNS